MNSSKQTVRLDQNKIDHAFYSNNSNSSITILEDRFLKSREINVFN